jgi:hypothetical protein
VDGGQDPQTGEIIPGCWDPERSMGDIPKNLARPLVSLASVDPSVKKWWAIQWWVIQPETGLRYLIDQHRAKMQAPDLLEWNHLEQCFYGVMEDWQTRSHRSGLPIAGWVIEQNAAHRYLLQYEHVKRWMTHHHVRIIGHDTYGNKADPKLGVEGLLGPIWRNGQVRLPGTIHDHSRMKSEYLAREVTAWPDSDLTDCLMAQWFAEHNWRKLHRPQVNTSIGRKRPSWMTRGKAA